MDKKDEEKLQTTHVSSFSAYYYVIIGQ